MKLFKAALIVALIPFCFSFSQDIMEVNTKDEAYKKLLGMMPKEDQFIFIAPYGWEKISLTSAKVIKLNDGEDKDEAQKIIDGNTSTTWKSKNYYTKPEVIIDLGGNYKFNRIVIYNRQSSARGTAGGNNALKTLELSHSRHIDSSYKLFGKYELHGPKATCVKIKDAGQICFFIDETKPNIIEIPVTDARYLKINFVDAFWGENIPDDWRDSFSLTEIMLFYNMAEN